MATRFDDWEGQYLQHYGVLGMKWGVHKDPQRAYEKATEKKRKLERSRTKRELVKTKANLALKKALAKQEKVENGRVGPDHPNYSSYSKKSSKAYESAKKAQKTYEIANFKATKSLYKEQKWVQSMLKSFGTMTYDELKEKYEKKSA